MVSTSVLLEVRSVTKTYPSPDGTTPVPVLLEADMKMSAGESVAIIGPSGSGKSTVLNLIGTLDQPDSGEIVFEDKVLNTLKPEEQASFRSRSLGFVFQSHHLLPHCSVLENVLIPVLGQSSRVDAATEERARVSLDRVGLGHRLDYLPGRLSGGERQRVAVVRALINQPRLLLADEPTGSLDRLSAIEVTNLLVELNQQTGLTLLLVTHSVQVARRMGRILEMRDGKLLPWSEESNVSHVAMTSSQ
jgi:ABC-type lipoprotein export system ATPase subunit